MAELENTSKQPKPSPERAIESSECLEEKKQTTSNQTTRSNLKKLSKPAQRRAKKKQKELERKRKKWQQKAKKRKACFYDF